MKGLKSMQVINTYRATAILSSGFIHDVCTVEHDAPDYHSFLAKVSEQFAQYDSCTLIQFEIVQRLDYTVKFVRGERVL